MLGLGLDEHGEEAEHPHVPLAVEVKYDGCQSHADGLRSGGFFFVGKSEDFR